MVQSDSSQYAGMLDFAGIGLCGGGCAKNSLLRKGSIWEVDDDICLLMEESVPWIIWKYYDHKVKPFVNGK